jgi:signal transduction histidine kinase
MIGRSDPAARAAGTPSIGEESGFERGVARLTCALLDVDELEPALRRLCDEARTLLGTEAVSVWLLDGDALECRMSVPEPDEGRVQRFGVANGTAAVAVAARDRRAMVVANDPWCTLVVPVMGRGGTLLGVVSCLAAASPPNLTLWRDRGETIAAVCASTIERWRLVERLQSHRDDVRELHRLKSDFIATMSHELRTPLNVVMGYSDLLADEAFGGLTSEQRGVLDRIQVSARELFELVTATLDLNRLEAGETPVQRGGVDVTVLMAELAADTEARPRGEDVVVEWQVAPALPPLETDRDKLWTVLRNIVGNAIKFTERGRVTVTVDSQADVMVFAVADTGIGIGDEHLPIIFDMFRQVEAADTRRFGGVGLGLYVVRRLLEELGGDVQVESRLGHGSRFVVRLPRR